MNTFRGDANESDRWHRTPLGSPATRRNQVVRRRVLLLAAISLLIPALVTAGANPAAGQSTGSLRVAVTGVGSCCSVEVNVTGPGGFSQLLSGVTPNNPQTINNLTPGTYTLQGGASC